MAKLNKQNTNPQNIAEDEFFFDQMRDSFVFFTALTAAGIEALAYLKERRRDEAVAAERLPPSG